jgi:hypothetical protein
LMASKGKATGQWLVMPRRQQTKPTPGRAMTSQLATGN